MSLRTFGLRYVSRGQRGDAGQPLREVQGDALGPEDATGRAMKGRESVAGSEGFSVALVGSVLIAGSVRESRITRSCPPDALFAGH